MIAPRGQWVGGGLAVEGSSRFAVDAAQERDDDRRARRMLQRLDEQRELLAVLGAPIFYDAVYLQGVSGFIEICTYERRLQSWSIWAPHRRLLIDVYTTALPSEALMEFKHAFAQGHGLRYVVVPPGHALTLDDVTALVASPKGAAA